MAERTSIAAQQRTDEPWERDAHEIRRHIAAERESITDTVSKLGDRLQQSVDWREYVADYPAVALGLAAGTGILLSAVFTREPSPQERIMDAIAELTEDLTGRISGVAGDVIRRKIIPSRTLMAAATTLIFKSMVTLAKRKIEDAGRGGTVQRPIIDQRTTEALSKL